MKKGGTARWRNSNVERQNSGMSERFGMKG